MGQQRVAEGRGVQKRACKAWGGVAREFGRRVGRGGEGGIIDTSFTFNFDEKV